MGHRVGEKARMIEINKQSRLNGLMIGADEIMRERERERERDREREREKNFLIQGFRF